MALLQYLEEGQFSTNLETGDYKVIVIGPGGDGGKGGKGGANPRLAAGSGGFGASANGVHITEQNFLQITAEYLAEKITGGNGSNGTAPASRQAVTGISGGNGGGGGGAWTNGKDGAKAIAPGRGVNGKGGNGGIGGLGAVWLMKLKNNTTKTH